MGHKNNFNSQFNWQSTSPAPILINNNTAGKGSVPSGVATGTMSGTNTIYSNAIEIARMDNLGLEITWTGTPTGTLSYMVSNSGINFYPLTDFNTTPAQPAGSAGGYPLAFQQLPFKYFMVQYTNSSGTGTLSISFQEKDLN